MKTFFTVLLIATGTLLSGCTTGKNGTVLDTEGPPLPQPTAAIATNGTLLVYSAYEVNADFNARDPNRPEHSDYKILTPD